MLWAGRCRPLPSCMSDLIFFFLVEGSRGIHLRRCVAVLSQARCDIIFFFFFVVGSNVPTPNCLLLGRATASNKNSWQPDTFLNTRHYLVAAIGNQFWQHWLELFAPSLAYRPKWSQRERDLKIGDVILNLGNNTLKCEYRLGLVLDVHPSKDGRVRNVTVDLKISK